jgi:hypothetical protein
MENLQEPRQIYRPGTQQDLGDNIPQRTQIRPMPFQDHRAVERDENVWNRHSAQIFADFNEFESPRGSRSASRAENVVGQRHSSSDLSNDFAVPPSAISPSSASSVYSLEKNIPEPPYHVFSRSKKKQLVYIASLAGLFSPLSSNIYFPALGQISRVCQRSLPKTTSG